MQSAAHALQCTACSTLASLTSRAFPPHCERLSSTCRTRNDTSCLTVQVGLTAGLVKSSLVTALNLPPLLPFSLCPSLSPAAPTAVRLLPESVSAPILPRRSFSRDSPSCTRSSRQQRLTSRRRGRATSPCKGSSWRVSLVLLSALYRISFAYTRRQRCRMEPGDAGLGETEYGLPDQLTLSLTYALSLPALPQAAEAAWARSMEEQRAAPTRSVEARRLPPAPRALPPSQTRSSSRTRCTGAPPCRHPRPALTTAPPVRSFFSPRRSACSPSSARWRSAPAQSSQRR